MNDGTLNKELILQVADKIEKFPISYDQDEWIRYLDQRELDACPPNMTPECGTAFCLAGHACWLAEGGKYRRLIFIGGRNDMDKAEWAREFGDDGGPWLQDWYFVPAEKLLGVDRSLSNVIFSGSFRPVPPHDIVSALRQWATTGDPKGCMIP